MDDSKAMGKKKKNQGEDRRRIFSRSLSLISRFSFSLFFSSFSHSLLLLRFLSPGCPQAFDGESPTVTGLLPSELLSFHLLPNDLRERTENPDQDDLNPVPSPSVATSNGQLWWCPFSLSTCRRREATDALSASSE